MYLHEQIALRMAQDRLANAVREAEEFRALHRARPTARIRLGRTLVRLGHWVAGQSFPHCCDARLASGPPA